MGSTDVLALIWLLALATGIVALVQPRAVALWSRWQAAPLLLAIFPMVGLAMIFAPDPAKGNPTDSRIAGTIILVLWSLLTWFAFRRPRPTNARRAATGGQFQRTSSALPPRSGPPVRIVHERSSPPKIDYDPNVPEMDGGLMVKFVYIDSQGEVTEREVRNWSKDDTHIEGFCLLRRAHRTFRLDRVDAWIDYA